jgi:energy-coupling factor transport system ATP-binding protein
MDPLISFQNLTFTYRDKERPALRHLAGQIHEGSLVVIMGHGGAGKSSLCYSLNSLVPRFFRGRYEGRVVVAGQEVASRKVAEMSRWVGLVLQDFEAQLFSTNVELELAFGPESLCLPRAEVERRVKRYLLTMGLEPFRRREPATLSGGQKQRLAIASVLALEPRVLALDEPTTDLDPQGREEILDRVRGMVGEGRTFLIVDHDPELAVAADQVWMMRDGELAFQGPPGQVLTDSSLLGSCGVRPLPTVQLFSAMNWPGRPLTVEDGVSLIQRDNLARVRVNEPSPAPFTGKAGAVVLETEGLEYIYPHQGVPALRGVDLAIREGEFVAILGQNGSGKTTLAKHLNGLLKPTTGQVAIHGKPTSFYSHREMARTVGHVFQNPDHQIFCRTVGEEVGFGLRLLGEDQRTIESRVLEALEAVGLQGYEEAIPFTLTRGDKQRVAVASVLAARPEVMVLDEPTTGLDYPQQRGMMEMLRRLHGRGHTIIVITHSMWVAAEYARRTVVMKDGRVLLDGPTRWAFAQENRLAEASLRPPAVVRLSNRLGARALTVEEMVQELKG